MDGKFIYILHIDKQNYPFFGIQLLLKILNLNVIKYVNIAADSRILVKWFPGGNYNDTLDPSITYDLARFIAPTMEESIVLYFSSNLNWLLKFPCQNIQVFFIYMYIIG